MGCNVMKFDLPTTIEAKFYPKNQYEECFLLGALSGMGYVPITTGDTIFLQIGIEDVEEFKIQIDCLKQDMKRYSERFVDYTR